MVFSKMYAFLIVVPGPTEQFGPRTDEMMETFSEMVVCEPMSVFVPMSAVLWGTIKMSQEGLNRIRVICYCTPCQDD